MSFAPATVRFQEVAATGGWRIGIATLDAPATLNALSLQMVDALSERLKAWAVDPAVAIVVLEAEGRALCAGGDLQSVYREMQAWDGQGIPANIARFFEREYALDYLIHTYPKPFLCWGNGIVMGGGMGLMIGASHRVVTETSRLAMPEIAIGLFPDVGMSWAMGRMPGKTGRFLALTGASIHAADALYVGWADYHIPQARKPQVFRDLAGQAWSGDRRRDDSLLHEVLDSCRCLPEPASGPLRLNLDLIAELCRAPALDDVLAAILRYDGEDSWLQGAKASLAAGAPSTARLAWELQHRARHLSLAQVFAMEYRAAIWCCTRGDFREGIRALLIDKDKCPAWKQAHGADVGPAWVDAVFREMEAIGVPPSLLALGA